MTNAAWSPEDVGMLLFAMYRVLFQSRPDAPNDMMIQIPVTCFILLPIMVTHFVGKLIVYDRRRLFNYKMELLSSLPCVN